MIQALTTTAALEAERAEKFAAMHHDANLRALSAEKYAEAMAAKLAQKVNSIYGTVQVETRLADFLSTLVLFLYQNFSFVYTFFFQCRDKTFPRRSRRLKGVLPKIKFLMKM